MSIFHDHYDGKLLHICGDVPEKRNYDYKAGIYAWSSSKRMWAELLCPAPGGCLTCAGYDNEPHTTCEKCGENLPEPVGEYPDVGLHSILETPYVVKVE